MGDWIAGIAEDCFRWIIWLFIRFFLLITDLIYDSFQIITQINISANEYVLSLFLLLGGLLTTFILYRIAKIVFKTYFQSDYRLRHNPVKSLFNIAIVGIIFGATPYLYTAATSFSTELIQKLPDFMDIEAEEISISDFIILGGSLDLNNTNIAVDENNELTQNKTDYQQIDINEKDEDDHYVYFDDTVNLLLLIIVSIALWYLMILISISYAVRGFSIAIKYICGVYFISGLIEDDDNGFKSWTKHLGADMITNVVQVLGLYLAVVLVSGEMLILPEITGVQRYLVHALLMIAAFMFVLSGPSGIAQMIGGDGAGVQSVIQAVYQAMTLKNIGSMVKDTVGSAAALSVYAAGRAAGAPSIAKMNENPGTGSTTNGSGGTTYFGDSNAAGNASTGNSGNFNLPPTAKQIKAAEKMGLNINGLNRGQVTQAFEAAGLDPSYWQEAAESYRSTNDQNIGQQSSKSSSESSSTFTGNNGASKPMTKRIARMMAAKADQNTAYRALYYGSKSIYMTSARKVASSRVSRPMTNMHNTARTMHMMFASNTQNGGIKDE